MIIEFIGLRYQYYSMYVTAVVLMLDYIDAGFICILFIFVVIIVICVDVILLKLLFFFAFFWFKLYNTQEYSKFKRHTLLVI